MTNLTEQWKQKKLHLGWYFVKDEDGKIDYAEYTEWFNADGWCGNYFECEEEIVEVLAEAPDYIEWQNMVNANTNLFDAVKMLNKDNFSLEKQNAQLKELLKECRPALVRFVAYDDSEENARILLMNKINEVLK